MKKIFIALFLIASFAVGYFIFFYDNNSLKARIRALAYEEDNVERYKMVKQMGKDYPGQPAVDEAILFKFITQKNVGDLPLANTISFYALGYYKQRQIWNGTDYKSPEYYFKTTTIPQAAPGDAGDPYDYKMVDVIIRDLGFFPKWLRDSENEWYVGTLEGKIKDEDKEIAEKIGQEILALPVDISKHTKIGSIWWKVENFEHPNYSPDPVQAFTFFNNRFEVEITGWNFQSLEEFKVAISKIEFNRELMKKFE